MSRDAFNKAADVILNRMSWVMAYPDDARVLSGELIPEAKIRKLIVNELRRIFSDVERAIPEVAKQCGGKTAAEISQLWSRKLAALKRKH